MKDTIAGTTLEGGLTPAQWATVEANVGLVLHVLAKLRTTPGQEWDDAYQDGLFGLMRAAQKFDPDRGFKFSTYAIPWGRQAVRRGRGQLMGVDFRAAQTTGDPGRWHEPMSTDAPLPASRDGDTIALADMLPAADDPAGEAVAAVYLRAATAAANPSPVRRSALAAVLDGTTISNVAVEHGVSGPAVGRSLRQLAHPVHALRTEPWAERALCVGMEPEEFLPGRGQPVGPAAVEACAACPVARQCLDVAGNRAGYWGGTTGRQRRTLRRDAA